MRSFDHPMGNGSGDHPCDAWEKSAAGVEESAALRTGLVKWQGFGWTMVLGAIAYGLFILWWLA
jgi:hypothetical protein